MPELGADTAQQEDANALEDEAPRSQAGSESPRKGLDLWCGEDTGPWEPPADEILPSKKVVILLADTDASRAEQEAIRPEPEPELQAGVESEPGQAAPPAAQPPSSAESALVTAGPLSGLVAPKAAVDELKLRWQRYSREDEEEQLAAPSRDRLSSEGPDVLFEELRAKWREIRGTTTADLRPDLQSLVAPLDVPKVSLGFDSPRCLEGGGTELLALGDAELGDLEFGGATPALVDAAPASAALPPMHAKAGVSLPAATPRLQLPEPSTSAARTPRKVPAAAVSLPSVGLHERGRQPLAGAATAGIHGKDLPRERQQIDENCVHQ